MKILISVIAALVMATISLGATAPDADAASLCWQNESGSHQCATLHGTCEDFGITEGSGVDHGGPWLCVNKGPSSSPSDAPSY